MNIRTNERKKERKKKRWKKQKEWHTDWLTEKNKHKKKKNNKNERKSTTHRQKICAESFSNKVIKTSLVINDWTDVAKFQYQIGIMANDKCKRLRPSPIKTHRRWTRQKHVHLILHYPQHNASITHAQLTVNPMRAGTVFEEALTISKKTRK